MIDDFRGEYKWLSNFELCDIEWFGKHYKSTEHCYQAIKSLSEVERDWVAAAKTPGAAKRRGRKVTLRQDWEDIKVAVMEKLLIKKFEIPELREKLLATGDQELVEGNTWGDTFWGVCGGVGHNHLGKLLMKVREQIREAAPVE